MQQVSRCDYRTLAIINFVDTGCKYLLTLSALVGTNC